MQPRTKHINQVYHHFQDFLRNGTIDIFAIESVNQIAYIFKNPLPQNNVLCHRKKKFGGKEKTFMPFWEWKS